MSGPRYPLSARSLHNRLWNVLTEFSRTLKKAKSMFANSSAHNEQEPEVRLWRFGNCEFDELSLQLRINGSPIELELKPLEVLQQLLLHAGGVVSKEDLLDSVWPGLSVVDGSLSTAISKLRKALGDENVIVTLPRVGYRLAVPVQSANLSASTRWVASSSLEPGDPVPARERWRLTRRLDASNSSEVWLAEHPKTHELRVFKFATNDARLKGLKREITVARFLRESVGESPAFVRVLEWNLETHPCFIESEYGGPNLSEWAQQHGGLQEIPLSTRIAVLADVAKAVCAAHDAGVLHKDIKPANVLIQSHADGTRQVKVADFGSASLVEPGRLRAFGITSLGLTQTGGPQSASLTGTLMYLAPEVLSGHPPKASADVYALGVMLYQIVAGDFRKPLAPGWEAGIDDPLLREDIADAACGDPVRRIQSAAELVGRLTNLDRRRADRQQQAEAAVRQQAAEKRRAQARAGIPWLLLAAVLLVALSIAFYTIRKKPISPATVVQTVAVLPFQNLGGDSKYDFLRLVLPDETATALSYVHGISIRPSITTRKYDAVNLDLQKAADEMGVSVVITGHFLVEQNQLHLTYEAVDAAGNHILWRDTIVSSLQNLIDARQKLYQQAQGGLAVALGARPVDGSNPLASVPTSEEAYDLYVRSFALPGDPESNTKAIVMLERAVQLDPGFAACWISLGTRYYTESHYLRGKGDDEVRNKGLAADERALALDPHYGYAQYGLALEYAERGDLLRGYRVAANMLRESPGNAISPYAVSYVLRYAGLDQEAETKCDTARSFDRQSTLWRSCGVAFLKHGDYDKALEYFHLDANSEWSNALTIDILLRERKEKEALEISRPNIRAWTSYDMLLACASHKPAAEIATLAKRIETEDDPETNYFAASHLAYCGQTTAALEMLRRTVQANYCAYPAMDTDPMFATIRSLPEYAEIRAIGMSCQNIFLTGQAKVQ
jgi:serine/threonine protein kinase/DNA-binding winged helix-turn-helix (wHTH) protein